MNHCIANCKAKIVFSGEKAENKDIKEYFSIKKEGKGGLSKSRGVLQKKSRRLAMTMTLYTL
jgi:hypothetical protein